MRPQKSRIKAAIIAIMVFAILLLHYVTLPDKAFQHAVYRTLFYLPLILGGLWFGLRGSLIVCGFVFILFGPFAIMHWKGLSIADFDRILEGIIFVSSAIVLGFVVERQRNEHKRRVEAERLAAVGKAVSELAHDMKTPLLAIGGFAGQVARMIDDDHPGRKKLNIVILETRRLESMVKEMLEFGRPLELALSQADLNEIILDCMELSKPVAKDEGVALESRLAPSLPELPLDIDKIKQVLLNLITNAVYASPAGERVVISTTRKKNTVIMDVTDWGCGIREEDVKKVFQPFFTTKKDGTGLGLAIVEKIVEGHEGEITLRANPDKGVTFSMVLPVKGGKGG